MTETKHETDRHETFVAEALMLRALHSYREARDRAKDGGVDLSIAPEPRWRRRGFSCRDARLRLSCLRCPSFFGWSIALSLPQPWPLSLTRLGPFLFSAAPRSRRNQHPALRDG
jgi:hypothetical protein